VKSSNNRWYAHPYGPERDELAYILDTFPVVRRKDEEKYGEYRTKRMILEQYEALEGSLLDVCMDGIAKDARKGV